MKLYFKIIIFILIYLTFIKIQAQNVVTGKIMDGIYGGPLQGVTIKNINIGIYTKSDSAGNFKIKCKPSNMLEIVMENYDTVQIKADKNSFNITLRNDNEKQRKKRKEIKKNQEIRNSILTSKQYLERDTITLPIKYLCIIVRNGLEEYQWENIGILAIVYNIDYNGINKAFVFYKSEYGTKGVSVFSTDTLQKIVSILNQNMALNVKKDSEYIAPEGLTIYKRNATVNIKIINGNNVFTNSFIVETDLDGLCRNVFNYVCNFGQKLIKYNESTNYADIIKLNQEIIDKDSIMKEFIKIYNYEHN